MFLSRNGHLPLYEMSNIVKKAICFRLNIDGCHTAQWHGICFVHAHILNITYKSSWFVWFLFDKVKFCSLYNVETRVYYMWCMIKHVYEYNVINDRNYEFLMSYITDILLVIISLSVLMSQRVTKRMISLNVCDVYTIFRRIWRD